jgi:hypothetical protein
VGRLGSSLVSPGDVDGDGYDDLVVGAPRDDVLGGSTGAVYVWSGRASWPTTLDADSADAVLRGRPGSAAGARVSAAGDVDGDGLGDLWVAGPRWGAGNAGRAWLLSGTELVGTAQLEDRAMGRLRGATGLASFGAALAGGADFDGDGAPDLLVGSPTVATDGARPGAAWAVFDVPDDAAVGFDLGARIGTRDDARAGQAVAFGDIDGDGFDDAVVGAPSTPLQGEPSVGAVFLWRGGADRVDEREWFVDADGDGWGDAAVRACARPDGAVDRGGDCDDTDAAFHPYALETDCADPADYNCDGSVGAVDVDGDGATACGGDCADDDGAIGPHAEEVCGDGLDNDCDTWTDDPTAVDALDWYPDHDHDGYGVAGLGQRACERPDDVFGVLTTVGGDCNDLDASISPEAVERCDLVDNDCDGDADEADAVDALAWYPDADGDGWGTNAVRVLACAQPSADHSTSPRDCDDGDPSVHPGEAERCNGVDDDCDGAHYLGGEVVPDTHFHAVGEALRDGFGEVVAVADLDGDGLGDVVAGAPSHDSANQNGGAVYVFSGRADVSAVDLTTASARSRSVGPWRGAELGTALVTGDFDGDGQADLAVGAPGYTLDGADRGVTLVWYGPVPTGELDPTEADVVFTGDPGDRSGNDLSAGDLDGDGVDELFIAAPRANGPGLERGTVFVFYGGTRWSSGRVDTADARIHGGTDDDELSLAQVAGDLDGDGHTDLAVAAPLSGDLDSGYVAVLWGDGTRLSGVHEVTAT